MDSVNRVSGFSQSNNKSNLDSEIKKLEKKLKLADYSHHGYFIMYLVKMGKQTDLSIKERSWREVCAGRDEVSAIELQKLVFQDQKEHLLDRAAGKLDKAKESKDPNRKFTHFQSAQDLYEEAITLKKTSAKILNVVDRMMKYDANNDGKLTKSEYFEGIEKANEESKEKNFDYYMNKVIDWTHGR